MTATVTVIGGGYAGITVAKALDDVADVTLVEPRDTFVHNVAALRAVTDPVWVERLFIPYEGLLTRGRIRHDRAARMFGSAVELGSGDRVTSDFVVLATGSRHTYPAKLDVDDSVDARAKLWATHEALSRAPRVLLLGAGPVGLEFAGEIKAAWPDKHVTVVDPATELLPGEFPAEFRAELHAQLAALGVELLLGTSLNEPPPTAPGHAAPFTATTRAGAELSADIWFACYGATPNTGYLVPGRRLDVTPELRLPGSDTIFAIGDITSVPEMKMARLAQRHAEVAAANIRALIEGQTNLTAYEPAQDAIVLPLGPRGGVSYAPEAGVLGAEATVGIKGELFLDTYLDLLGAEAAR
ncbi:NAD(P)/FAD-dependent oxidoreductase [Nonomuraea sp. NPDC050394]|uniref:NAD(P)/FAD-dependent oxidoreductase n=1 Tax=Nonomuraea sp. NPDC050394 TaxID=3364363 RepID=UPI0037A3CF7E